MCLYGISKHDDILQRKAHSRQRRSRTNILLKWASNSHCQKKKHPKNLFSSPHHSLLFFTNPKYVCYRSENSPIGALSLMVPLPPVQLKEGKGRQQSALLENRSKSKCTGIRWTAHVINRGTVSPAKWWWGNIPLLHSTLFLMAADTLFQSATQPVESFQIGH